MMHHVMSHTSQTKLNNVNKSDIQPNAVDLRIAKVYEMTHDLFEISEDHKKHRGTSHELKPGTDGYFYLPVGQYEIVMENIIQVGHGEAGWVITRSTLNRNGLFLTSGLYDSGYHGVMAAVLHVTQGPARIKQGTRVGQYLSFKAETLSLYNGDYGFNKDHDKKYGEQDAI